MTFPNRRLKNFLESKLRTEHVKVDFFLQFYECANPNIRTEMLNSEIYCFQQTRKCKQPL